MEKYSALSENFEKEPDKWDGSSLGKLSENLGIVEFVKKEPFNRVILKGFKGGPQGGSSNNL